MVYTLGATSDYVVRDVDSAHIPNDTKNNDWQIYQTWIGAGNTPNPYVSPAQTRKQQADALLATGLICTFQKTPTLNATYGVVAPYTTNMNSIQIGLNEAGGQFPHNGATCNVIDLSGTARPFTKAAYPIFYATVRDFLYDCDMFVNGVNASLPSNNVSINA